MNDRLRLILILWTGWISAFVIYLLATNYVFAATVTIYPDADGSQTGWADEGGTYEKVDETSHDSDGTYLYAGSATTRTFTFGTTGLTDETINSITLNIVRRGVDPSPSLLDAIARIDSTNYVLCDDYDTTSVTTYITHNCVSTVNPDTSTAWTVSDVEALEAGVSRGTGGGQRLTQFNVTIDYEDAPEPTPTSTPTATPSGDLIYVDIATGSAFYNSTADFLHLTYVYWLLTLTISGITLGLLFLRR